MRNRQKPTMGNVGSTQASNITLHYTGPNGDLKGYMEWI